MSNVDDLSYQIFINQLSQWSEVILSAGSIGSPQLLLLSGIGPLEQLNELNITVLLNLNSVGKRIQDPPRTTIILESPEPLEFEQVQVVGIIDNSQVIIEAVSFFEQQNVVDYQYMGAILTKVSYPLSRGELQLSNKNPQDNPLVRYNYFSHPFDIQECILGVRLLSNLTMTTSIQKFTFKGSGNYNILQFIGFELPQNQLDNNALGKFCKDTVQTFWHYHGGCEVDYVIDKRLHVKDIDNLRVVDASIFKDSPGTNPQATIMMLGRYAGVQILQEWMNICEY
ncbi:protein HOTHEAD-like [Cryptomeria japonica]|uniref:protein HOTHEAD-like n=1 Tax=Cryptomeria japonica TaxID=3369 RepID=UPI0027DA717C|nr:protein HOTHEAD-like [Cryptomeria japonica]